EAIPASKYKSPLSIVKGLFSIISPAQTFKRRRRRRTVFPLTLGSAVCTILSKIPVALSLSEE
ncbi:hypothetical protein, partial [Acinetobacter baumannii]|uniref:hypothetical protein n=1 Tax=Acinetobacter baumannii TaxID=470 RepID=UPI001C07A28A